MTIRPDTRKLLTTGSAILAVGCVSVLLLFTAFGGVSHDGPHTNMGWLALMVAMGCLPTGLLTLVLGIWKLFGDRARP
jgi:hypothetical protein